MSEESVAAASKPGASEWPAALAAAAVVFLTAFVLYLKTLAPAVGPTDSGELTSAAWSLGNAHPPGFPFFLLATHVFTWLPFSTFAVRTNIASAFFASVACALVALAAGETLLMPRDARAKAVPREEKRSKKKQRALDRSTARTAAGTADVARIVSDERARISPVVVALISLTTGLLFAFSRTLWQFATVTEVYAINSALMAGVAWGMLRWARTRRPLPLIAAALLFGLGLCVHHVTIGTGAIAIAVLITRVGGRAFWRSRTAITAAAVLAAGLLVYAYLPIAASRKPVMNWGDPVTASRIWDHVTGKQYRGYIKTEGEQNSAQFDKYFTIVGRELGPSWAPIALLLAGAGIVLLYFRLRTIFWYVVLVIAGNAAWFAIYPITNDTPAYAIPTFIALLDAFAFAAMSITELAAGRGRLAAATALLLLPVISLVSFFPIRDRSRYWVSHDYAENALHSMRPNALLITGDWQLFSPLRYELDVEHERPDVEAIDASFLLRHWYFEQLGRRYPVLARDSGKELGALAGMTEQFANDRAHLDDELFNRRLDDAVMSLIAAHLRRGPVYITGEIAATNNPRDANLRKRIDQNWVFVPRGLLIELVPGHNLHDVKFTSLPLRGIADGTVLYEDDDVVPTEIMPAYRVIFMMTGRYLAIQKKFSEAMLAYRAASEIDPTNLALEREMRLVESRTGG
jgi:hypothetical protein